MNPTLRILHLEDDPKDAEIVQGVLETGGIVCEVTRVDTEDDFVASLERGGFELILADFSLPSFDGLSALKLARERRSEVPFIFVSGTLGEEVAIDALKIGATDYVVKGRLSRIVSSVHRALRESRERAERERAEQQLRRSEAFLAEGQRISHTGSWGWIISTGKVTWSDEQYRMFGFEPGKWEPSVDLFLSMVHTDDQARIRQVLEEAMRAKTGYEIDYRVVLRDGAVRHMRSVARPVPGAAGEIDEYIGVTTDVTERVAREGELRRSQHYLAEAQRLSHIGGWAFNAAGFEYWSPELFKIHGLDPGGKAPSIPEYLALVHPEDRDFVVQEIEKMLAGAEGFDFKKRIVRPDGAIRHVRCTGIRAATGGTGRSVAEFVGTGMDVTEQDRAEGALRESEERYERAMVAAEAGFWDWDVPADKFYASPKFLEMMDLPTDSKFASRSDFITRASFQPDDRTKWEAAIKELFASGNTRLAMELRTGHGGEPRWCLFSGLCVRDAAGKILRWAGSATDVTERKRAEEALRQSEERFALAVEGANEGIFDWDLASDRVYVSYRAQELFGLPRGELWRPRRDWRRILAFHPDDSPRLHDSIKGHIEGSAPTYDEEFRIVLPDGGLRWFRQRGIALRDESGKAYRVVGSIGDVTEKHKTEEELRSLERKLRTAQRLEAMGTLAGGIAHDFNNILGAILGYGERALRDAGKGSRLRHDLDSILAAGERGRALVDRILAFSRGSESERVAVHVEQVVREAVDLLQAKLPDRIRVEARLDAGRAAVLGDPTQVHQVVMNLGTNAVQAMPAGGTLFVLLDVARFDAHRTATIGGVGAGEWVVLKVVDSGGGIGPDIVERIFDPFFTTKEPGVGTGLGLSLVLRIVTEAGGAIDVASTPGVGSTFTVYLPRAGDAADTRANTEPAMTRGEGQRVLVVDDEEPLLQLAARTLEELGYAPVAFTSSTAALDAFRADPRGFDAVVTDERMPGITGVELIRQIRDLRNTIPILLVSGYVGGAVTSRAYSEGADEVLKKPLSAQDLAENLARVLRQ